MTSNHRGADVLVRALEQAGLGTVFTLSGNHIMPVFDAAIGSSLKLVHVRHEGAAVHMADAYARLTGKCGVALCTGGPGHANAVGALYTALAAESPMLLLSGHAGLTELGRGAFQEMPQAAMAATTAKAAWTVGSTATLAADLAKALRLATTGRPGPVHLSLPFDVLEETADAAAALAPAAQDNSGPAAQLDKATAGRVLAAIAAAERPLVLAGPWFCQPAAGGLAAELEAAIGAPVVAMGSPRGVNDPALGAFAEVLARADLIVLLAKPHDFTLKFADPPAVAAGARFIVIDPDQAMIERAAREKGARLVMSALADGVAAARSLIASATDSRKSSSAWVEEVAAAVAYRPPAWAGIKASKPGHMHPLQLCAGVDAVLSRHKDAVLIADGGEIGQWAQAAINTRRRIINGVSGSIGGSLPFAIAARTVEPKAPIVAVMGDGTFGFHMAEIDTAVRCDLPIVAVIGNDAAWNAEYQIQLRSYGPSRTHGCELLPSRYDQVAAALGGDGELVTEPGMVAPAIERAIASAKPAVVNVMIERHAAPVIRR